MKLLTPEIVRIHMGLIDSRLEVIQRLSAIGYPVDKEVQELRAYLETKMERLDFISFEMSNEVEAV
jgi:hypothetical protein